MATVGEVTIKLGGDAAGFLRTIGSVGSSLTSAVGSIVKAGALITGAFAGIGGIGLGLFINQVSNLGDELLATSQKTGFTVENLSALKLAAKLNNAELGDLTTGIRLMQRNLANADEEGQAAKQTLMDLGFTTVDITRGMTQGEGFLESFAQKLAGIEEPANRVQVAMAVMGRQGSNLIPLLLDIADRGMAGIRRESDQLGATFSTKLAVASDRFRDNMDKLGAALTGLKVTIIGPLVTALATLTEQFLRSDLFAGIRAQIDALASSGKLEEWAKKSVFFVIDAFMTMTRSLAIMFPAAATAVVEAMRTITSAVSSGLATLTVVFGNMTIAVGTFLDNLASIPFIGRVFEGLGSQVRTVGGDVVNSMHQASLSLEQFSRNLAVPQGVNAVAQVLETVATSVQNFGTRAKASFETVKQEITRTVSSADVMTQPLDEATTSTGELVKVSGGVGVMFDRATGQILAMNRELFGTLTLVRQINAEAVNPVQ